MKRIIFCIGLLLATSVRADAPLAKIEAMLIRAPILCGRFEQTKQLTGLKKALVSSGRFCAVAEKGVLWRTLKPFPSTLRLTRDEIVNLQGERVAMRLEATKEPAVRLINTVLFSLLAGDLAALDRLFDVDGSATAATWQVALKARQPALAKAIGSIALEGGSHVRHITISEAGGDSTSIIFSAIQTGAAALLPEEAALF